MSSEVLAPSFWLGVVYGYDGVEPLQQINRTVQIHELSLKIIEPNKQVVLRGEFLLMPPKERSEGQNKSCSVSVFFALS